MSNLDPEATGASWRLYFLVVLLFGAGILFSLYCGGPLAEPVLTFASDTATPAAAYQPAVGPHPAATHNASSTFSAIEQNANSPLSRLLVQIAVIVGASWLVGWVFRFCGQPAVLGEMIAGILLGPSLFGWLAPRQFNYVFAPESLDTLRLFSQIGVCFFMFAVGMELDLSELRHSPHRSLVIGHSSILIPYFLGVLLAVPLYRFYAQPGAAFAPFALIMGISMSITAFPVLVRILQDRGLFKTKLGGIATLCAAVGDATAWLILAFVVAVASRSDFRAATFTLCLVGIYALVMLFAVRPILQRTMRRALPDGAEPTKSVLALAFGIVLVSALCTELMGIHALFGAFVAGIAMPAGGGFRNKLIVRTEHLSGVLLLPVFFAFIGLRTQIGLLDGMQEWLICFGIIAVAMIGKVGGTAVVSRMLKMSWRDSLQLGALMNTRGLMELIALNIGYDLGILSLRIFTMLVIMALVTTFMTGPLLTLFRRAEVDPA
ncbi:MAG TPA: cation:proton antiporter [Chthoniobacterales bacterium]